MVSTSYGSACQMAVDVATEWNTSGQPGSQERGHARVGGHRYFGASDSSAHRLSPSSKTKWNVAFRYAVSESATNCESIACTKSARLRWSRFLVFASISRRLNSEREMLGKFDSRWLARHSAAMNTLLS